jgi:hypothetical protein
MSRCAPNLCRDDPTPQIPYQHKRFAGMGRASQLTQVSQQTFTCTGHRAVHGSTNTDTNRRCFGRYAARTRGALQNRPLSHILTNGGRGQIFLAPGLTRQRGSMTSVASCCINCDVFQEPCSTECSLHSQVRLRRERLDLVEAVPDPAFASVENSYL